MIRNERAVIANSLWTATANASTDFPALSGETRADVAVVGAGYTGLSAALHLAESGATVAVLEAQHPGWGASGRNGGQVNVGLKDAPSVIKARFGDHWGSRMIRMAGEAGDLVFDLIDRHGIDCAARRPGWLRAAHSSKTLRQLHVLAADWADHGGGMDTLDRDEMQRLTGTDAYLGGVIDRRGGSLHPLNYALGLAAAARAQGVRIFGDSPTRQIARDGAGFVLRTPGGSLRTSKVLLCTNAYSGDVMKPLSRSILPVRSVQVATAPLSDDLRRSILPKGHALSDARRLLLYFRQDPEGRFIMGGRGTYNDRSTARQISWLRRVSTRLFPQLQGVDWEYAWGGYVALTPDHYPHLHEIEPGMIAGLGYNGRGVAIATAMGRVMAQWAAGTQPDALAFPTSLLRPLPFAFARTIAVEAKILRLRLLDKLGV